MLRERFLPPAEWPRLAGTLLDPAWRTFSHSDKVIVVEDEHRIVACTALIQVWHLEGTWVDPSYRCVSVGRRLVRAFRAAFRALRVGEVCCMATNPETAAMCRKLGPAVELRGTHFAVCVDRTRPVVWREEQEAWLAPSSAAR